MQNACRRGVWLLETTTSLIARISSIAKESHDMCLSKKYLLIRPSFGFCMNPHEWSETNWNVCWVSWTLPSIILLKFFLNFKWHLFGSPEIIQRICWCLAKGHVWRGAWLCDQHGRLPDKTVREICLHDVSFLMP